MSRVVIILLPVTLAYIGVLYFVYRRTLARTEEHQLRKWVQNAFFGVAAFVFALILAKLGLIPGFRRRRLDTRPLGVRLLTFLVYGVLGLAFLSGLALVYATYYPVGGGLSVRTGSSSEMVSPRGQTTTQQSQEVQQADKPSDQPTQETPKPSSQNKSN